jgi:hypothetical protein
MLLEHSIFDDDLELYPLVTFEDAVPRFYYSYWLCDGPLTEPETVALLAFRCAVERVCQHRRRLLARDLRVVDNGWMLHGRTSFRVRVRHLRRFWLEPSR